MNLIKLLAQETDFIFTILSGGVSAFAFQGTNAHTILSTKTMSSAPQFIASSGTSTSISQKQCFWVLPPTNVLVCGVWMGPQHRMTFSVDMTSPALAFFLDHRVMNRAVLPATGEKPHKVSAILPQVDLQFELPVGILMPK